MGLDLFGNTATLSRQIAAFKAEVLQGIRALEVQGKKNMSGLSDLQASVTALTDAVGKIAGAITALESAAGDPDATVESLSQSINAQVAVLNSSLATVNTGGTAPAPAPPASGA